MSVPVSVKHLSNSILLLDWCVLGMQAATWSIEVTIKMKYCATDKRTAASHNQPAEYKLDNLIWVHQVYFTTFRLKIIKEKQSVQF